ncbi:hypothetical protein BJY01DRAFT_254403 [Aspergillus pseudoustus]|uniref:Uncharacterized protein n=1 Tax=Aspergillus pseudoustus TaxID=1810923 RepID=A0ABR4IW14_9EURO
MPQRGTMHVSKASAKRKGTKRKTSAPSRGASRVLSAIVRTSNSVAVSLRGDDLRWLISELHSCRGSDPTVHIIVHEESLDRKPKIESQPSPPSSVSSAAPSGQISPTPNILDTLRVTTRERDFLQQMATPQSCDEPAATIGDEECHTGRGPPEAYLISADLSDTEWNTFTTL